MVDKRTKKIMAAGLLVLFVLSLTVSAASAAEVVSLSALQQAAKLDPARAQGGTTPGAADDVKIVEVALAEEGLLSSKYAYDGSYGTTTIKAYKKWQESLGSAARYCDGIPGQKDLTKLGQKYGFTVDTSTTAEKKLNVPLYLQTDSRWSAEKLGYSQKGNTIGSAGCAITSVSMVFKYYAVQTDPKNLNTWLKQNNGYSGGDVIWENAPGISKGKVKFISRIDYKRIPADLNKINTEINNGHPVIAQVKPDSNPHFVVITGYSGSTYYINDPIYGKSKLSDHYNKDPAKAIYGIRIYH
ncbi:hypothetical protein EQO05_04430 [Methanosarcina sp. MSH10X1]|uniref:C39 family peptidase n=1 Tax=Methanosarcina sp. MSH10X1 TaxID=2507075 RepID=UPI000FFB42E2|nr:C39 family peptidase [Methanosarcina sp. MSH10X1]RXA20962.1 hypothetical protein EQO05_04430 [Methanosarcina sp. MSH10X1]